MEEVRTETALNDMLITHEIVSTHHWLLVLLNPSRNIPTKRKQFGDVSKTGSLSPDRKLFV